MTRTEDAVVCPAKIKVIGVGGGGCNAIDRMIACGMTGAEFISVNTDIKSILNSNANKIIQIGEKTTQGLGAGARPEFGEKSALESEKQLREAMTGADMIFITAGMGGGTGTGAAPVVAKIARELDILTVGIVTKPFSFEGVKRMENAVAGIEKMKPYIDSLVVILNSNLFLQENNDITLLNAFCMADNILKTGIQSITDTINTSGLVSLDFADVRTIMKGKGLAHMGIGKGKGSRKAVDAAINAVNSPLLETSIEGATSLLVNISGCEDMGILEVEKAVEEIRKHTDKNAEIILGASLCSDLDDEMVITLIATGINEKTDYKTSSDTTQKQVFGTLLKSRLSEPVPYFNLEIPTFLRTYKKSNETSS